MSEAYSIGRHLARSGYEVVYGGSKIGLMGAVANGALSEGGKVIGVLPGFMSHREIAHDGLSRLIMVDSMQERKLKMHELSDAVIALPGGFGTFEELFEMLTWGQLGLHQKPMGLLNIKGYYNHLDAMIKHMTAEGLLKDRNANMLLMANEIQKLLDIMAAYNPPEPDMRLKPRQA